MLESEFRRVAEDYPLADGLLYDPAVARKFFNNLSGGHAAHYSDPHAPLLQVFCNFDLKDGDDGAVPFELLLNEGADFTFHQLVDFIEATGGHNLQGLLNLFEGVAFDYIALFVIVVVCQTDTTFEAGLDFFHFILESAKGRHLAVEHNLTIA